MNNETKQENHLIGVEGTYLKLSFYSVDDLVSVRKDLQTRVRRNLERTAGGCAPTAHPLACVSSIATRPSPHPTRHSFLSFCFFIHFSVPSRLT